LQETTSLYQSLRQKQGFQIGSAAKNRSKAVERDKPFAPLFVPPRQPEPNDIQADLKYCLYCIYNNADPNGSLGSGNLSLYLKHLMRIQKTLRDCLAARATSVTPNSLFSIFEANIREFMGGIRDKLVDEIR